MRTGVVGAEVQAGQAVGRDLLKLLLVAPCSRAVNNRSVNSGSRADQAFALLHQFTRLATRWNRRLELHDAFVSLPCNLICWRRLKKAQP